MKDRSAFASCFALALLTTLATAMRKRKYVNLQNNTDIPLQLKLSDKIATFERRQGLAVKLPVGTRSSPIQRRTSSYRFSRHCRLRIVSSNSTVSIAK